MAERTSKPKQTNTPQQRLWDAADKLRGNQEPSESKRVVLKLVILKYNSDRFEQRRGWLGSELLADGIKPERIASFLENRHEYTNQNAFWVPENARWGYVQSRTKLKARSKNTREPLSASNIEMSDEFPLDKVVEAVL